MKRRFVLWLFLCEAFVIFAQVPYGSATIRFSGCFTTYGVESKQVVFPFVYDGVVYYEPVSNEEVTLTQTQNVRGCDSIVSLTLTEKPAPLGALNGNAIFSVSATQKVFFSKGNLQYQSSTDTWRFAPHQYDCIGSRPTASSVTWGDLFPYGTSGTGCTQGTKTARKPYEGSYVDDYPAFDISETCFDWGANQISQAGNSGDWRVMTLDEWTYLREHHSGSLVMITNVDGKNYYGYVMFPDEWSWPVGVTPFALVSSREKWTQNFYPTVPVIELSTWEKMETMGAVFFPAGSKNVEIPSEPTYGSFSSGKGYFLGTYDASASGGSYRYAKGFVVGTYDTQVRCTTTRYELKTSCCVRLVQNK